MGTRPIRPHTQFPRAAKEVLWETPMPKPRWRRQPLWLSCTHPSRVWHIPLSMTEGTLILAPHSALESLSLRQTLLPDSQGSWEVAAL